MLMAIVKIMDGYSPEYSSSFPTQDTEDKDTRYKRAVVYIYVYVYIYIYTVYMDTLGASGVLGTS